MKNILVWITILCCSVECLAQKELFENRFNLDSCSRFGSLWGNEIKRWEFEIKSESALGDNLWEQILPKSTLDDDKIIISRNELDYFLKIDVIKSLAKNQPISNPTHWESRFGKQIQTIKFEKPLHVLTIKNDKLVKMTLDSLIGLRHPTFYPHGKYEIVDKGMAPIVYRQENQFDLRSPALFVTCNFLEQVDFERAKINKETINFGTKDFPGILYKTGIDFNSDGQDEVLMYHEEVKDTITSEGDEDSAYMYSIIAMYFKNKWYRTSYWVEGPNGVEGF